MNALVSRFSLPLTALALMVAAVVSACGDDVCIRDCPSPQVCVLDDGQELCLVPDCGDQVCRSGEACVDNVCRPASNACSGCTSNQHCVEGVCVDDYTDSNVCDPLRQCRRGCGTNARCLAACDADRSSNCASCLNRQDSCLRSENCTDPGPYTDCCETQFCQCFPSSPGCPGVAACVECQQECGSSASCFNGCRASSLACNLCLQPFDQCAATSGSRDCADEFCECLDHTLTADCSG